MLLYFEGQGDRPDPIEFKEDDMAELHDLIEAAHERLAAAGSVHVDAGVARRLGVHKDGAMVVLLKFEFDIVGALINDVGFKNGQDPLGQGFTLVD